VSKDLVEQLAEQLRAVPVGDRLAVAVAAVELSMRPRGESTARDLVEQLVEGMIG
jgi:hypothetical protein